jgi:hypothetical protein
MPDENVDLREPLFLILKNGQKSISALYAELNDNGIKVTRQYVSGYLMALWDFGFLKRTSIKPAIVYSISPDRTNDLYNSVGLCAKSITSEEPGDVALLILHSILKRPIFMAELDKCQVRRPTKFRPSPGFKSDLIRSRLAELGINLEATEIPVEPQPEMPTEKRLQFLIELLRLIFKTDGNAGATSRQAKLDV